MRLLWVVGLLCCVAGCGTPTPDTPMQKVVPTKNDSRIQVQRVGVFEDELAYGNVRGIYLIKDTKTGKEFLGVSGVGISSLGSHSDGDDSTSVDER